MADNDSDEKQSWLVPILVATVGAISMIAVALLNKPQLQATTPPSLSSTLPSTPSKSSLPEKYEYTENGKTKAFVHVSDKVWKEEDEFGKEFSTFKEIERDSDFITIFDVTRDMTIKIPIEGGNVLITWKQENWVDLPYRYVAKK